MKHTLLLVLCLLMLTPWSLPTSHAQNAVNFVDSEQALGNRYSYDVEMGDLDSDGDLDTFVANWGPGSANNANTVWINAGDGQFSDSRQTLGDARSYVVALGDVDNDGDLDAFVGNVGPNRVWINNGNATFTDSGALLGDASSIDVALADLDNDGDLDAVVANGGTNQRAAIWINQGEAQGGTTGVFLDNGSVLDSTEDWSIALGDLDGDGELDAVTAAPYPYGVPANRVWLNDGTGALSDSGQLLGNGGTQEVVLGDLDGDGDLDIFFANDFGSSQVWFNQGGVQGGTASTFIHSGQDDIIGSTLDAKMADLDNDGDLDVFLAHHYNGPPNSVWLNDGTGHLLFALQSQQLGASVSYGVALGDVDGNGLVDAFVANYGYAGVPAQPNRVWKQQASSARIINFVSTSQHLGYRAGQDVALGYLTMDGTLDAFVANKAFHIMDSANRTWRNNEEFSLFGRAVFFRLQTLEDTDSFAVALGDVDNDGNLDAVVANDGPNRVWLNPSGDGRLSDSGQTLGTAHSTDVALGDLDNDGDLDAVVANRQPDEPDTVWLNQGGVQGGTPGHFADSGNTLGGAEDWALALGDLDNDGDLDVVTAQAQGSPPSNHVWLNDGTGAFRESGQVVGTGDTTALALGDLDGDSDLDIFVANDTASSQVWLNRGGAQGGTARHFVASGQDEITGSTQDVALGDLDNDGDLDAFLANDDGEPNGVWVNNGTGTFTLEAQVGAGYSTGVALGDLDDNGSLDAFVTNTGPASTAQPDRVWLNTLTPANAESAADLSITMNLTDVDYAGDKHNVLSSYSIQVRNDGPDPAYEVVVRRIDVGFVPFDEAGAPINPTYDHEWVFREIAQLLPGEQAELSLTVRTEDIEQLATYFAVSSNESDSDLHNNWDGVTTTFLDCPTIEEGGCPLEQLVCGLEPFPVTTLQAQPAQDTYLPDLTLFYQVRDDILQATPVGQRYTDLYYRHGPEIVALFASDETLRTEMLTTLELWEPNLRALVEGDGAMVVITENQEQALDTVLERLAADGSAALQQTIAAERAALPDLSTFIGLTMDEAHDTLEEQHDGAARYVVYLPGIQHKSIPDNVK